MIVGIVQTIGVMRYSNDGIMQPNEKTMMVNGLEGTLIHLPIEVTEQVANISAPLMAAFGFLIYATRLSTLELRRRGEFQEQAHIDAAEHIFQEGTPSPNGTDPRVPPMDDIRERFGGGV